MQRRTTSSKIISLALVFIVSLGIIFAGTTNVKAENTVDDFVNRCYKVALGREADTDGFNFWKKEITEGRLVGSTVVHQFIFSAEYESQNTSDKQFVNDLYTMFMGRPADQGGYDYWCARLKEGHSRESIFAGFANSDEFYEMCADCNITAGYYTNEYPLDRVNNVNLFVERMYKVCLGRIGDKAGQEFWVKGLLKGELQGIACAANFFKSKEYTEQDLLSTDKYIKDLYVAMMGREFDKGGLIYWMTESENGLSDDGILLGFATSKEFSDICARYGIVPGTFTPDRKVDRGGGSYTEFDSNNKWVCSVQYSGGKFQDKLVPEYNSDGCIVKLVLYDANGKQLSYETIELSSKNRPLKITNHDPLYGENAVSVMTYDSDGMKTKAITKQYDAVGVMYAEYEAEYEDERQMVTYQRAYDNGTLVDELTIYY